MYESACSYGKCDGTGLIVVEGTLGEADNATRCDCEKDRIARRRTRRAERAIPPLYHDLAFDRNPFALLDQRSRSALKRYVDELPDNIDAGRGLWLTGDRGIGKTCSACWIALEAGRRNYGVAYHNVGELFDELKTAFSPRVDTTEGEIIQRLMLVDLLILDDLAAGHQATEWVLSAFYRIINGRHDRQGATIVTTDVDREQLGRIIGERVVRRLEVTCGDPLELRFPPPPKLQAVGE